MLLFFSLFEEHCSINGGKRKTLQKGEQIIFDNTAFLTFCIEVLYEKGTFYKWKMVHFHLILTSFSLKKKGNVSLPKLYAYKKIMFMSPKNPALDKIC